MDLKDIYIYISPVSRLCWTNNGRLPRSQERQEADIRKLKTRQISVGFGARLVLLALLWCWLVYIMMQVRQVLATSALYQNFDPYAILEVGGTSSSSQIKKAFHKLSLKYHPDKNPDAAAAEKFILIKKAYDALTDPVAKRNYRRCLSILIARQSSSVDPNGLPPLTNEAKFRFTACSVECIYCASVASVVGAGLRDDDMSVSVAVQVRLHAMHT
ncbi:DnaJ protein ERDJ2 (Chaperone protein dnaJ C43) (OsDjC43) (Endoplasmic reticulum dnaJ domain-containing protein 2) (OsERdj2) [Durusdinium trenchii]|uniref:DnaJ protein ERDJ2 (Chaperone protein dnaJ C43) (OsDjC43) (Endoplasmic reticulum dnaJ domain-containing protein 2) (OsERdj2) n=1 Tax=Durusdinium trenchii TaxID=1381693 RepID=A0ABP0K7S6_9DINO